MYVYERPTALRSRIFVILYNDRASDPPPPRDVTLSPPRAASLAPLQPVCMGSAAEIAQLSALIPHEPLFTASGQSSGSTEFTASSQPRVRAAVRLTRVSKFLTR